MPPREATFRRLAARITLWQVAAAAVVLVPATAPVRAVGALVVALLIGWTGLPVAGRTGDQWMAARLRFRRRMRRRAHRPSTPIEALVSGVETRGHVDRAGNRVGLLADGPAWTAVFRLNPVAEPQLVARLRGLLDELHAVLARRSEPTGAYEVRVAAVQLVGWSIPVPGAVLRTYWVAVRFLSTLDPSAVRARGGGEQGAIRAAAAAALRLATALRANGYGLKVLDGTELTGELGTSLGVEPPPRGSAGAPVAAAGPPPPARETWRSWSLGALHHACFRLAGRSRSHKTLARALTLPARPPAITMCVSVLFTRDAADAPPRSEVVVRVAVPAERNRRAVRSAIRRSSRGLGGPAVAMHGEHRAGVRATIPLASAIEGSPGQ